MIEKIQETIDIIAQDPWIIRIISIAQQHPVLATIFVVLSIYVVWFHYKMATTPVYECH